MDEINSNYLENSSQMIMGQGEKASNRYCDHVNEVQVVVINNDTPSEYLHLVYPSGQQWKTFFVNPMYDMMLYNGMRVKEVLSVKPGSIGYIVFKYCVKCHESIPQTECRRYKNEALIVWFGSYSPSVRGLEGILVGKEKDRSVVKLKNDQLVLFHGNLLDMSIPIGTDLKVWACRRVLDGQTTFLEGCAGIVPGERQYKENILPRPPTLSDMNQLQRLILNLLSMTDRQNNTSLCL